MKAPARLGLYGAALIVVFAASATIADAVVPEETVAAWTQNVDDGGGHSGD